METLKELQPKIIEWAKQRNILFPENAPKQYLKLLEEIGETSGAILKNNTKEIKDGIGDIFVVLIILTEQLSFNEFCDLDCHVNKENHLKEVQFHLNGIINSSFWAYKENSFEGFDLCLGGLNEICKILNLDLIECANIAWDEIKDRKGETVDGTFIKQEEHRDGGISVERPEFPKNR